MQEYEGRTVYGPNGEVGIIRGGKPVVLRHTQPQAPALHQIVAPHQSLPTARDALGDREMRARIGHIEAETRKITKGEDKADILTNDDLDMQAALYLADPKAIAALGYKTDARQKVVHRATELAHQWGMTVADILAGRAKLKAGEFSYRHFMDRQQAMEAFAQTAAKNGKLALELARQVQAQGGNTGIVPFNRWLHNGMRATGNVQVDQLYAQLKTTADEYAKITSSVTGAGSSADSAMQRSEAIFDGAKTLDQISGIINGVMLPDIHNRTSSNTEQLNSIIDGIRQSDPGMADRLKKEAVKAVKAPGDIAAAGNTDPSLQRMTPQQIDAYRGIVADAARTNNPNMIDAFMKGIGHTGAANAKAVLAHYKKYGTVSDVIDDSANARQRAEDLKAGLDKTRGKGDAQTVMAHNATLGLDRPAAGVTNAAVKALGGDFNIGDNYAAGRDAQTLRVQEGEKSAGAAKIPLEIIGGFAGANPGSEMKAFNALSPEARKAVEAPSVRQMVGQGAKVGGGIGAFSGFNNGTGFGDSALGAIKGGIGGAIIGGGLPGLVAGAAPQLRDFGNIVRGMRQGDPNLSAKLVADALKREKINPQDVTAMLRDAHSAGQPMTIADLGENPRALAGSMSRYPEGRAIAAQFTKDRQDGQGGRIIGAIEKHLGPITDVPQESDRLGKVASQAAKPLYSQAYWAEGAANFANRPDIQGLLRRPSMQKALKGALTLAKEEGRSPAAIGLVERPDGSVELGKGLSWRSLDYIKRGLDGIVEGAVTQRGKLSTEGRAYYGTLRTLREKMKVANPAYGEALKAYSDPAQQREALEMGQKALKLNQSQLAQVTREYSPSQMAQFKLGFRSSLAEALDGKGDNANKVLAVLGDPRKRKALGHLFGDQEEFGNFVKFLQNEHAMHRTFQAVHGNSATAGRGVEDAVNSDAALADKARAGIAVAKDGIGGVRRHVLGRIDDAIKFGHPEAAQKARENAATMLFSPDTQQFRDAVGGVIASDRKAADSAGAFGKLVSRTTPPVNAVTGNALGDFLGKRRPQDGR